MSLFRPQFGMDVLVNAALWVIERLPENERRLHKLFKVLWFADLEHLKKYGRTVTGDTYVAMEFGPVPSVLYDEIKHPSDPKGQCIFRFDRPEGKGFLSASRGPDMDFLSATDVAALQQSLDKNMAKSFRTLTDDSHRSAWNAVRERNFGNPSTIGIDDILDEIGADGELREQVHGDMAMRNMVASIGKR